MEKNFRVTFRDQEEMEFKEGTTFKEISEHFKSYYKYDILSVQVDNDIVDLNERLVKHCNIEFFDRSSSVGNAVYARTACLILLYAVKCTYGYTTKVIIENSMDNGIYCNIEGARIDKNEVAKIEQEMRRIVSSNIEITKVSTSRLDAIKYFKKANIGDKVNLLKYISNTYINLYKLDFIYDYFYGRMAYSTGQINSFKLTYVKDNGLALSYPTTDNPEFTENYTHHDMVFQEFEKYKKWCSDGNISTVADLNRIVSRAKTGELINLSEIRYNNQLVKAANEIVNSRGNVKIVLMAGPSSSGKTTTARKLDLHLKARGFFTHSIELDNYFTDMDKRVLDEDGKPDFESIKAIDVELFNQNLNDLLDGKKVELPTFNFILGKREYNGEYLQLGSKDIIIVEGLHALNEELTKNIDNDKKYKIYISPLTTIHLDDHNYIHTSDIRKLRRIVRDNKTRGFGARETLAMWPNVQKGEKTNIFKFQDNVDAVVNSSLLYEIGVLKTYVEPLLFNVNEDEPEYPEALRLINFLRNFLTIPSDDVPQDSVLREFIGGSCFRDKD
ncbi:MAG: nucleoside kinase [bacterium]|nr:nucleoside kinase [bacterium]